jgi:FkbM family methyltransferase
MNWKHFLLRGFRKVGLLRYLNLFFSVRINGKRFKIPVFHGIGIDHFGAYESWMTHLIGKLISLKKGQFIDVGVNIGQTLLKLKSVTSNVSYVGFEPNPKCVYYLSELVRVNSFDDVRIIPSGIYGFDGIAQLFVDSENEIDSCATLLSEFRSTVGRQNIPVPVISQKSIGFLDVETSIIKIDVEGSEADVIEQFNELIRLRRPFVICEILPAYHEQNAFRIERQRKIESFFKQIDYKLAQIGDQLVCIDAIPVDNDIDKSNYLFFPYEYNNVLR